MRLLDVNASAERDVPEFRNFADSELEEQGIEFAILSHRWGNDDDEVSFADIKSGVYSHKTGYAKLRNFCKMAASLDCRYAWADTCCINKGDLVELNEAINSMYRWYRRSKVCIVYLKDAPDKDLLEDEWFDRGWTLQELIAPIRVHFFDRDWRPVGTKDELLDPLSQKTRIPREVLNHERSPATCSIAQRMSWAANRRTKREEDRAYSILGILGVNMPAIYGEGGGAFIRLQYLIVQQSKDESIFAWSMGIMDDKRTYGGLFAPSPSAYLDCSDVITAPGSGGFSVTNGEMAIRLKTLPYGMETYRAVLNCALASRDCDRIAILITRTSFEQDDEYVRIQGTLEDGRLIISSQDVRKCSERYIRVPIDPEKAPLNIAYGFWLRTLKPPGHEDCQVHMLSRTAQSQDDWIGLKIGQWGTAGIVYLQHKDSRPRGQSRVCWLKLGFDQDFGPMLLLGNEKGSRPSMEPIDSRIIPDAKAFEQAVTHAPGSDLPKAFCHSKWITTPGGVPNRSHGWGRGFSTLKVKRQQTVSGCLEALNLGISIRLQHGLTPNGTSTSNMTNNSSGQPTVWVVDITDAGGEDPELTIAEKDKEVQCALIWSDIYCCLGCGTSIEGSVKDLEREKNDAHRQCRFLNDSDLKQSEQSDNQY